MVWVYTRNFEHPPIPSYRIRSGGTGYPFNMNTFLAAFHCRIHVVHHAYIEENSLIVTVDGDQSATFYAKYILGLPYTREI